MTQIFSEDGKMIPVTMLEAGPCIVTQIKTTEKEGYNALQLGFGEVKAKKLNRPMNGHFEKAETEPKRYLAEVRVEDPSAFQLGQEISVELFSKGDRVDISGNSKGKGFAGVIKRHNFAGGPGSHGTHFHRAPGSIGACATPSRVFKGTRMPGRMGNQKVTALNLEVVDVKPERNLLLVRGSVPGPDKGLLVIRESVKAAKRRKKKAHIVT
ncbi:MAG: 50S ribosomal protein L3 [Actinobacteria bacterium RBG_19FT_COMBO_54_7]|uniref:Large ribosomal subunit protein uL3 n=1 Tax=Candidatus Solincola sediminis TaxID=1797199 RepID=A0A1F2WI26_9ACTN|nr:MAG: 50S ribosomal protein L3 [Candidatus Solincola sediminis]OFW59832.1 MAG: 50S ribosomal protein L3 [Candidatus Solincola sediminis]OFW68417.1 MAG: 50S ribosomal protein L3 [Actinobacteria bacterium RBG_19FT_COMBO_54_7]